MTGNKELMKMTGFDEALLGECARFNTRFNLYDKEKVIIILVRDMSLSREEAEEWWSVNMIGSWVGESTPAFLLTKTETIQ